MVKKSGLLVKSGQQKWAEKRAKIGVIYIKIRYIWGYLYQNPISWSKTHFYYSIRTKIIKYIKIRYLKIYNTFGQKKWAFDHRHNFSKKEVIYGRLHN